MKGQVCSGRDGGRAPRFFLFFSSGCSILSWLTWNVLVDLTCSCKQKKRHSAENLQSTSMALVTFCISSVSELLEALQVTCLAPPSGQKPDIFQNWFNTLQCEFCLQQPAAWSDGSWYELFYSYILQLLSLVSSEWGHSNFLWNKRVVHALGQRTQKYLIRLHHYVIDWSCWCDEFFFILTFGSDICKALTCTFKVTCSLCTKWKSSALDTLLL